MWVMPYRSGPRVRLDQGEAPELAGGEPRTMVILRSSLLVCCQQSSDFGLEVRAYSGDGFGSHVDSHAVYEDGLAFDTVNWRLWASDIAYSRRREPTQRQMARR
jgi:hypothetical protein